MANLEVFGLWFELCLRITHGCVIKSYLPPSTETSCRLVGSSRGRGHTTVSSIVSPVPPLKSGYVCVKKEQTILPPIFSSCSWGKSSVTLQLFVIKRVKQFSCCSGSAEFSGNNSTVSNSSGCSERLASAAVGHPAMGKAAAGVQLRFPRNCKAANSSLPPAFGLSGHDFHRL